MSVDNKLEAEAALKESNDNRINDDHEDLKKYFDVSDLLTDEHSSYHKEKHALDKRFHESKDRLFKQKDLEIASLNESEKDRVSEIETRYNELFEQMRASFNVQDDALKAKYHDELTYHINPRLKRKPDLLGDNTDILLSVKNLKQFFFFGSKIHNQKLKAVSNVSFDVHKGECFGIVGESGCGKTTTGRTIIRLYKPTSGSIYYRGYRIGAGARWNQKEIKWTRVRYRAALKRIAEEKKNALIALDKNASDYQEQVKAINEKANSDRKREAELMASVAKTQRAKIRQIKFDQNHVPNKLMNEIQMVFQDPVDSLDPRMTVEDIIQEGLIIQGHHNRAENHKKVVAMLEKVGLVEEHASRYPHEFSGGQRQRIGIARALVMNPKLLICDEPISALDVSIRAQILNLLNDLRKEMGLTLIFIAHDLSVVKYFCDRIAVMYYGKLVELATSDELFKHPLHPYTVSLLSAIPKPNPLTEKDRVRILYKPWEAHDYSVDKPELREPCPGHFVYCNEKEFVEFQARIKDLDAKK